MTTTRNYNLQVRQTADEHRKLRRDAIALGYSSVSAYLRALIEAARRHECHRPVLEQNPRLPDPVREGAEDLLLKTIDQIAATIRRDDPFVSKAEAEQAAWQFAGSIQEEVTT